MGGKWRCEKDAAVVELVLVEMEYLWGKGSRGIHMATLRQFAQE